MLPPGGSKLKLIYSNDKKIVRALLFPSFFSSEVLFCLPFISCLLLTLIGMEQRA
jgi:hypothetical protein